MGDRPSDQEIIRIYQQLRQEMNAIMQKMNEVEADKTEHKLVIDTLKPLDSQRKCFRLIGGILVERTVGEVLPALEKNFESISQVVSQLSETFKSKEKEITDLVKKYNIQVKGESQFAGQGVGA